MPIEVVLVVAVLALLCCMAVLALVLVRRRRSGRELAAERTHVELLDEREARLIRAEADLDAREATVATSEAELGRIAGLTVEEARAEVMVRAEASARLDAAQLARERETEARSEAEAIARSLITSAMQRVAAEQTAEASSTVVQLPGEELKGRIIGREGRNIKAFEQVSGVNLLIDDTPATVVLSSFDPQRREVARLALDELVTDGRINPARIEAALERAQERVAADSLKAAEDALVDLGITDIDPGLLPTIGALRFRTSYGQNVLAHLVESGRIAALLASELGVEVATAKRAAFLHDLGKALPTESSHALAGADLARRFGEHPDVVHAIEAHHNEVEPRTVEAVLVQVADAISGSRPGARAESLELYVHRLQRLEELASEHPGVEKVYALQAGREVRVMVAPDQVGDAEATALAHEIAARVEAELSYPGSIKVVVVRESRATAVAH